MLNVPIIGKTINEVPKKHKIIMETIHEVTNIINDNVRCADNIRMILNSDAKYEVIDHKAIT